MKQKNESKLILKQWVKMGLVILALVLLAASIYSMTKGFLPAEVKKEKVATYNYNANINYKVYLKDNEFFTADYLGMDSQYITALIDYIEFNPRYTLNSDMDLKYDYNYQIVATAKSTYDSGDGKSVDVWSKSYPILPQANKTASGKSLTINETVKINYQTYNDILLNFRKQFGLSVDASVDVALKVVVNASSPTNSQVKFDANENIVLMIPLLKSTTTFDTNYSKEGTKTIYNEINIDSKIQPVYIVLGAALLVLALVLLYKSIKQLLVVTRKSEYVLAYNKILKNYSDIIAEAENVPDLTKYDVISINRFEDLVDIEEELHSPILCVEIRENFESWFIILNEKTAYRYILRFERTKK